MSVKTDELTRLRDRLSDLYSREFTLSPVSDRLLQFIVEIDDERKRSIQMDEDKSRHRCG